MRGCRLKVKKLQGYGLYGGFWVFGFKVYFLGFVFGLLIIKV
jgi:hypothetical protein